LREKILAEVKPVAARKLGRRQEEERLKRRRQSGVVDIDTSLRQKVHW
jgi:hypothetical protein